jgi:hypothetical protein
MAIVVNITLKIKFYEKVRIITVPNEVVICSKASGETNLLPVKPEMFGSF